MICLLIIQFSYFLSLNGEFILILYQLKYKFSIQFSINVLAHSMIKTKTKESNKSSTLSWKDKNNALGIVVNKLSNKKQ